MRGCVRRWTLIGLCVAGVLTVGSLFQPTVVVGNSMSPTLRDGRVLWIDRTHYRHFEPRRGEVVVFHYKGQTCVKRIYRVPGESVHYLDCDGEWIAPIRESRIPDFKLASARYRRSTFQVREVKVPKNHIFVMGDNVHHSEDSRKWGPIPLSSVIGRAHADLNMTAALKYEIAPQRGIPFHRYRRNVPAPVHRVNQPIKAIPHQRNVQVSARLPEGRG